MNWADITIIGIILLSALISLFRGLIREVLSLVAWVAAFWAAMQFSPHFAAFLEPYISVSGARTVLAFLGILIGTLLVFGVINFVIGRLIEKTGLSGPDRLLGAMFGLLRGAAIVSILVFLSGLTPLPQTPSWKSSLMLSGFQTVALMAVAQLPFELAKHFSY